MDSRLRQVLRFRISFQTMKDYWKTTLILTLLFAGMATMYAGMYPAFKDTMKDVAGSMKDQFRWIPGAQDMTSYIGFLNIEMYQIFWVLVLGLIIGFIAASSISKEIESKTIDLLLSNPISRKQLIFEKFIGLIPMILVVDFVVMFVIMGITIGVGENLNFGYLFLTHVVSIPYFLSISGIGILISVCIDEKMRASLIMMAIVVVMFIFDSIAEIIPSYKFLGYISLKHYFNPYNTLKFGKIDTAGIAVLLGVTLVALIISIMYFERKDIKV